uniref:YtzH-like family protein n=1 Tax=Bacillus pumilus TaxID=1408 RepID=UPI001C92FA67
KEINETEKRSIGMGLKGEEEVELMKDILRDEELDWWGSVGEYEEVGGVIELMVGKEEVDGDIGQLLRDIYD